MTHRTVTKAWVESAARFTGDTCHPWPFRNRYPNGYGRFNHTTVHREVCRRAHGEPDGNKDAAHSCGNRLCCNPQHLRWATRKENLADRVVHGTLRRGDSHPNTKHSDATINELVRRYWAFVEQTAAELKMSKGHAHRILRGAARTTET